MVEAAAVSIVLLSGGIDSTVCLDMAVEDANLNQGRCVAVAFDYGQRHRIELESAQVIADHYNVPLYIMPISGLQTIKSALIEGEGRLFSEEEVAVRQGIAITYVPARNTLFLAHALLLAEEFDAQKIWFGANLDDQKPYPDCRPAFFRVFNELACHATAQAQLASPPQIITPLLDMTKKEVIDEAKRRKAPLEKTWSCYSPLLVGKQQEPCRVCSACLLRSC